MLYAACAAGVQMIKMNWELDLKKFENDFQIVLTNYKSLIK